MAPVTSPMHLSPTCHATTRAGLVVPVVDIGHPAFFLDPGPEEVARRQAEALADLGARTDSPSPDHDRALQALLEASLLGRTVAGAQGTYASGLGTYLLKLGPDNLGPGFSTPLDRKIASSFPCLAARLRLRDTAHLLADHLEGLLETRRSGKVHLVDLGGGPSLTVLNALMVLRRRRPECLEGRNVDLLVLDLDEEGPAFGVAALAALRAPGAPLDGLEVSLRHALYDWSRPAELGVILERILGKAIEEDEAPVFLSEGGLFDYASDPEVEATLARSAELFPRGSSWVGTMSRADGEAGILNRASGARLVLREVETLVDLGRSSGWSLARFLESPLSLSFLLSRRSD